MNALIRPYQPSDYEQVLALYKEGSLYGGQFDENRDSAEKLQKKIEVDSHAVLVAEKDGKIVGTVSLIEDGRVAWLFRFCVLANDREVSQLLFEKAQTVLKNRGHNQVLVYAPVGDDTLEDRYDALGFTKGKDYTCFWKDI